MQNTADIVVNVFGAPWPQVYYECNTRAAEQYCGDTGGTADPDEWDWLLEARKHGLRVKVVHARTNL